MVILAILCAALSVLGALYAGWTGAIAYEKFGLSDHLRELSVQRLGGHFRFGCLLAVVPFVAFAILIVLAGL